MGEATQHPLVATVGRLDAANAYVRFLHGEPGDDGWTTLRQLRVDALVEELLAGETGGRGDVAASFAAGWLADAIAVPPATALLDARRAWRLGPDDLALHRDPAGWPDGVAVLSSRFWCLPDDSAAGHPDADVVATNDELVERWAEQVVAALDPLFAALRRRLPYGVAGMWGSVADAIAGHVVRAVDDRGGDVAAAWRDVDRLLDALADRAPRLRVRPRLLAFPHAGTTRHASVRGTCCLWYKTAAPAEDWCTTCPLRDDHVRVERLTAWLEGLAAG